MAKSFLSPHWHRVAGLQPRLRTHVRVNRQRMRGQAWYVVQDVASGRLHRFTTPAYLIVGSMNGRRSIAEIWQAAIERLGDDAPSQTDIVELLSQLHAADLIQTDIDVDTAELLQRFRKQSRQKLRSRVGNPLSIRIPIWDPDGFLTATAPLARPFFGWFGALLWCVLAGTGLVLAGLNSAELTGNVADHITGTHNFLLMAALFPVLKLLHELGHGYACKLRGGVVHEMGVMLLVLAPVPYVDASSSAGFRSRRDRILVAAAGMLVETGLAAAAMILWVMIEPGLVRTLAFQTMVIAGISTVVFNINPLLKLDGYFILTDAIDMPNLGQRATRFWADLAERRLLGVVNDPIVTTPGERAWLATYAPLSYVYRVLVTVAIALFVADAIPSLGIWLAIVAVITAVGMPLFKIAKHVLMSPKLAERRGQAVAVTFGGTAAVIAALMLIPTPLRSLSEGVVWLPESALVRVLEDGFLEQMVAANGATVAVGDLLLVGSEPMLQHERIVTASQIEALQLRYQAERLTDRVQAEVTAAEMALRRTNLAQQNDRLARLSVRSAAAGQLALPHEGDLPGRFLKRGETVGFVLPPGSRDVRVVVEQADIELVRQRLVGISVMSTGRPGVSWPAEMVREVPGASVRLPSRALSVEGGGRVAVDPRDAKQPKTLEGIFEFDILVPVEAAAASFGARVLVRFDHGYEPIGWQLHRRARQLFLARLQG